MVFAGAGPSHINYREEDEFIEKLWDFYQNARVMCKLNVSVSFIFTYIFLLEICAIVMYFKTWTLLTKFDINRFQNYTYASWKLKIRN